MRKSNTTKIEETSAKREENLAKNDDRINCPGCNILKAENRTIISFSSSLDKYNDIYIAKYKSSFYLEEQKVYLNTKQIYYKDKIYKWSVSYVDESNEEIFDNYENCLRRNNSYSQPEYRW